MGLHNLPPGGADVHQQQGQQRVGVDQLQQVPVDAEVCGGPAHHARQPERRGALHLPPGRARPELRGLRGPRHGHR